MNYEDEAFDELEKSLQRKVATGVTDGSIRGCMTQEIIEMARQAGFKVDSSRDGPDYVRGVGVNLVWFAKLVAAKERQRIISVNASEIEKCNAYIKELEDNLARGKA